MPRETPPISAPALPQDQCAQARAGRAEGAAIRCSRAKLVCVLAGVVWTCALTGWTERARAQAANEYDVKAALLFRFSQFVDWPPSAFVNASDPITIGVLGDDSFGNSLDQIVQGETVHGRSLSIKRSKQVADLKGCQVIFISKSEAASAEQIIATLGDASILTVGESDGFAKHGGVINFYVDGDKVHFEVNPEAAKRRKLNISYQLLRAAKIVH